MNRYDAMNRYGTLSLPLALSHILNILSIPPVAKDKPVGEKASALISDGDTGK
jgi:hypothetical protein